MSPRAFLTGVALAAVLLAAGYGGYSLGHHRATSAPAHTAAVRKPLYWVAPMNPGYHSDKPGKSPMGMDLVPVYGDAPAGAAASDVSISPDMVQQLGVRTAEVKEGLLKRRIEDVGYVGYDEDRVVSINTRAEGWIETLNVKAEGDAVKKGQPLYALFSPKLATAEEEYLTALASGIPALTDASRQRLLALGVAPGEVRALAKRRKSSNRIIRYADQPGVVMMLGVRAGEYVKPATQVMKIGDLSSVWILAEVDESEAAALHPGQPVTASIDAFPGRRWTGQIDYIYPNIVAATRTVRVRLRFPNQDGLLRPNMYAHVAIDIAAETATYIPESALIRTGSGARVAVALGKGRFDICPVVPGFQTGQNIQILQGIRAGQRVVVSAQFLIDSEANLDEAKLHIGGGRAACLAGPAAMKMPPGAPPMASAPPQGERP